MLAFTNDCEVFTFKTVTISLNFLDIMASAIFFFSRGD